MMKLLRLLALNALFGFSLGAICALFVVHANIGGIGDVLADSESRAIAYLLLIAGFGLTFASAAMGGAIMLLGRSERD